MKKDQVKQILLDIQKKVSNVRQIGIILKKEYPEVVSWIYEQTNFLDKESPNKIHTLLERIFCIENNILTLPLCNTCKINRVTFVSKHGNHYYSKTCSSICSNKNKDNVNKRREGIVNHWNNSEQKEKTLQKTRNTCNKKYGVDYPRQLPEIVDKGKESYFKKTSYKNPAQNPEVLQKIKDSKIEKYGENYGKIIGEKISKSLDKRTEEQKQKTKEQTKQTCLEKYGVECIFSSEEIKEKSKKTCLEKYGVEFASQSEEIKEKSKKTCLEKYGVEYSLQSENNKEKSKQTCLEKYGVEFASQSEEIKEKSKQTLFNHYGVTKISLTPNAINAAKKNAKIRSYKLYIENNEFDSPLFSLDEYLLRSSHDEKLKFKCKICGYEFSTNHWNGIHKRCPKCFSRNKSHKEGEITIFLRNILSDKDIETTCRKCIPGYELDIFLEKYNLAIEFDGLFWHNNQRKPKNYHLEKTQLCENKNIHLVHIFENEWNLKQKIVKSRLKNLLGIYDKVIYARKCQIMEVNSNISLNFLDENHLQGGVKSKVNLGLYFNNELVSLMTFSKPRFNKKYEWELVRFCNKLEYHIPGAASKLLTHFERLYKPKSIISYADRRWTMNNGNTVYDKLGFKLNHISRPDYWYFLDRDQIFSRLMFQKHKLSKILKNFDPNLTENENMEANGYMQIYDCGNLVFVKNYI